MSSLIDLNPSKGVPPGTSGFAVGNTTDRLRPLGTDVTFNDPSGVLTSQALSNNGTRLSFTVDAGSATALTQAATWAFPLCSVGGLAIGPSKNLLPSGIGYIGLNTTPQGTGVVILSGIVTATVLDSGSPSGIFAGLEFSSATEIGAVSTEIEAGSGGTIDVDPDPATLDVSDVLIRPIPFYPSSDDAVENGFRCQPYLRFANGDIHTSLRVITNLNVTFSRSDSWYYMVAVLRNATLASPVSYDINVSNFFIGEPLELK